METNTLLTLILIVLGCGFAIVSHRLMTVTRAFVLATASVGDVLHRDVGTLETKLTSVSSEVDKMIQSLVKDLHTVLLSTAEIESYVREAGKAGQAIAVIEGLDVFQDLVELAKSIDHSLTQFTEDTRSMRSALDVIADNTSVEPDRDT
jgi:methyl coenzyme M reductase beta subunit